MPQAQTKKEMFRLSIADLPDAARPASTIRCWGGKLLGKTQMTRDGCRNAEYYTRTMRRLMIY